jgi:hypothetical protein
MVLVKLTVFLLVNIFIFYWKRRIIIMLIRIHFCFLSRAKWIRLISHYIHFRVHFNYKLAPKIRYPNWSLFFSYSDYNFVLISHNSCRLHVTFISYSLIWSPPLYMVKSTTPNMKMEAPRSSETLVSYQITTRHHDPESRELNFYRHQITHQVMTRFVIKVNTACFSSEKHIYSFVYIELTSLWKCRLCRQSSLCWATDDDCILRLSSY